ncbi:MAG: SpaA isopeptide-forming pilin-related protein [Oribacterium sp.]|nr:SpaA isopeptide-forming pilin-related protein [Oribacterium sp.]
MKDIAKRGLVGLLTVSMCLSNVQGIAFADNRVEVGGVKVDGKKVTLNLNGGSLMEAARAALADANVYDDTYIAVSKDAKTQAAYRALTDGSNPLYELALFSDGELQALEDAGVEIVALIQMDQKQAEAAGNLMPATASEIERSSTKVEFFDPSKDEGKEILLYQPDSLFAGFYDQFSNQLMNASEKEIVSADPSTYELSGDEKVTFLFINHADVGRTFNLELNGESLEKGIKVAKAESVIKGVMSTLDVSGIEETLETPAPETSATVETGAAVIEPSSEAATQPSTETAIEPSTEASGDADGSIVILPETGATAESGETETSAAVETSAAQPTEANAETGLPAEGQTSTENTEQPAAEKTAAAAENTGIVDTVKEVIETIAENANATMMKIERRLGVIRAEAAESDEAVVENQKAGEAPKPENADEAPKAEETPKTEGTPAAGTENEAPKLEETPAPEGNLATGSEIEAPKTEETTVAAEIETTAAVKTDMDIALENERKALLKETRAADLVDSSVASARVLQYTLDDLSKSFWSAEITDRYEVNVFAEDTAFTEAVELELKELAKPEEAAAGEDTLNEKQVEALKAEGSYKNSRSLDIRFVNASGADVEPASAVKVRIKVYKNALPEDADISTMAIKHLAEKEEGIRVDTVAEYQEDTQKNLGSIQPMDAEGKATTLSEDENTEAETASTGSLPEDVDSIESMFKVESFSAFTITWGVNTAAGVIVHYVDENGKPVLNIPKSEMIFREDLIGKTTDINEYQGGVSGYEFVNAKLFSAGSEFDPNGGTLVSAVKSDAEDEKNVVFYDSNAEEIKKEITTVNSSGRRMARAVSTKETNKQELYLVYRPQVVPVGGEEKPLQLEDPDTSKTLTDKGNGTYDLTLSVTGKSVASSGKTKANVIIVFDSSGSMGDKEWILTPTTSNYGYQYGVVNGQYEPLDYSRGEWYYWNGREYIKYTGTRYIYTQSTRLNVAKQAVKSLAKTLLANNTKENDDAIEIALIDFATRVNSTTNTTKYTQYPSFEKKVNRIEANGGTNWEAALNAANTYDFKDDDPVYIIFVSDGDPTYRTSANGYYYDQRSRDLYGSGNSDDGGYNLDAAKKVADLIVKNNKHLYMVGAFGNVSNMQNLNDKGKYYDARDQVKLNNAFTDIIKDIQKDLKYIAVSITDGITNLTSKAAINGKADAFTYKVTGSELSVADQEKALKQIGKAQYDETTQSVVWNLGDDYKLIPGATYSVSFKVWPKQEAYDVIADLNNGLTTWEKVQTKYPGQFERTGTESNYSYSLLTNTSASVSYKTIETTNGTEGTPSAEKIGNIQEKPSMPLVSTKMTVQKIWQDNSDSATNRPKSIVLNVIKDGKTEPSYKTIELTGPNDSDIWTGTIYIAPGLKVGNEILEEGHVYTLTESAENADRYEFETETVHPMLVNSNVDITFGGTTEDSIITATNKRRGDIEIRKNVVDLSGKDISADNIVKDIPFTFTLQTLTLPNGQTNVSAQRYNISYDAAGAETETPDGKPFTVAQGRTFSITTSQKVKLLNVPIGTTYEIVETAKSGYELDNANTKYTSGMTVADTNYVAQFTNKMTSMDITFLKASKTNQSQHLYGVKLQITRTVNGTEQPVVIESKTDANGIFKITEEIKDSGMTLPLTDGAYTVKEVQAPDGYQLLTDAFTFTIQGGVVKFTNLDDVQFKAEGNTFTVLNTPGIALPETGGMGTLMTSMSGMALMLIALGYLVLAKRREEGGLH